jgi:hypothetical protein
MFEQKQHRVLHVRQSFVTIIRKKCAYEVSSTFLLDDTIVSFSWTPSLATEVTPFKALAWITQGSQLSLLNLLK